MFDCFFTDSYKVLRKRSILCSLIVLILTVLLFSVPSDFVYSYIILLIGAQLAAFITGLVFLNYRKISREKIPAKKTALFFKLYSAPVFTTIALLILYFLRLTKRI